MKNKKVISVRIQAGITMILLISYPVTLFSQEYIPFRDENNNWGYKDKEGNVVIQPVFGGAKAFKDGLAVVASRKTGLYGIIDAQGNLITETKYYDISPFCEGYAVVQYGSSYDSPGKIKRGVIDKNGVEVIKPRYLHVEACPLPNGWFKVQPHNNTYGEWQYANIDGRESKKFPDDAVEARATFTEPFEVKYKQNMLTLEDKKFKIRKEVHIPAPEDYGIIKTAWISDRLLAITCDNIKYSISRPKMYFYKTDLNLGAGGLLEHSGVVLETEVYEIFDKHKYILIGGKWLFDLYGDFVGYFQSRVSEGGLYIGIAYSQQPDRTESRWEFINKAGNKFHLKFSPWNIYGKEYIIEISDGKLTSYSVNEAKPVASYNFYDDEFLEKKLKPAWYKMKSAMYDNDAYPVMTEPGKWTFVKASGALVGASTEADFILPLIRKVAPVTKNDKWGLMNKEGLIITPIQYDSLSFDGTTYFLYDNKARKKYFVSESGALTEYISPPPSANVGSDANNRKSNCTCLIYSFNNPNLSYDNRAYILVDLCYYPDKADHNTMARWVKNAIGSEIQSLWSQGYQQVNEAWNNVYQADILGDRSCYFYESEFKMKSSRVSVFRKNFY